MHIAVSSLYWPRSLAINSKILIKYAIEKTDLRLLALYLIRDWCPVSPRSNTVCSSSSSSRPVLPIFMRECVQLSSVPFVAVCYALFCCCCCCYSISSSHCHRGINRIGSISFWFADEHGLDSVAIVHLLI